MSTGDDNNIEKYETDPRYQDEVAIRQETTRRWLIWGAGIVGLAVFMVALLSYLVCRLPLGRILRQPPRRKRK